MKTITHYIRNLRLGALIVAGALVMMMGLASCGVTEPDDAAWKNVSSYSWPTQDGAFLRYRIEVNYPTPKDSSNDITIEDSDVRYHGQAMHRLQNANRPFPIRVLFLPLTDTLVVLNEDFGGTYHLVGPLDKGHTWISGYSDNAEKTPSWRATVVERFTHLQLEGLQYNNVVVVKYEMLDTTASNYGSYWLRFYAEGQGPIQTLKHLSIRRDQSGNTPTLPVDPTPETRSVLIKSTPAAN